MLARLVTGPFAFLAAGAIDLLAYAGEAGRKRWRRRARMARRASGTGAGNASGL